MSSKSREEAILQSIIDTSPYDVPPRSRIEYLLLQIKEIIESGGGGGTTDYTKLTNLPAINGVTVTGDNEGKHYDLMDQADSLTQEQLDSLIALL